MVFASGSDNNHVSLRHSPRHFPEGNLVPYTSVRARAMPRVFFLAPLEPFVWPVL